MASKRQPFGSRSSVENWFSSRAVTKRCGRAVTHCPTLGQCVLSSWSPIPTARTPGGPATMRTGSVASPSHVLSNSESPTSSIHRRARAAARMPFIGRTIFRSMKNGRNGLVSDSCTPVNRAVRPCLPTTLIDVPSRSTMGCRSGSNSPSNQPIALFDASHQQCPNSRVAGLFGVCHREQLEKASVPQRNDPIMGSLSIVSAPSDA